MKLFLIPLICIAALVVSCHKSGSDNPSYYIRASVDGTAMSFSAKTLAGKFTNAGTTTLSITGAVSSSKNLGTIQLYILNVPGGKPIVAGTYSETDRTDFSMWGLYYPDSTNHVYQGGQLNNPANPFKITITSIDNTAVKGSFSGDYYFNTGTTIPGPEKKTFTNGEFYVKF